MPSKCQANSEQTPNYYLQVVGLWYALPMRVNYAAPCPTCKAEGVESGLVFDTDTGKYECSAKNPHVFDEEPKGLSDNQVAAETAPVEPPAAVAEEAAPEAPAAPPVPSAADLDAFVEDNPTSPVLQPPPTEGMPGLFVTFRVPENVEEAAKGRAQDLGMTLEAYLKMCWDQIWEKGWNL